MIDLVEEYSEYQISPLIPVLDEFEANIRDSLAGIKHSDLKDKLILEAKIYGELVQTMDKHGMRTYGLATAIKKYYNYLAVEVFINGPKSKTIRVIKIPLK
jgi:hypothetical protein